jgi:ABC-2 type transport system permease protein
MNLRLLWRLVACNVMVTLEYRAAFLIYMLNTVAGPVVMLAVWLAVSAHGVPLPYDRSQLVTYYLMLGIVVMLTGNWAASYVAQSIRTGKISPLLLRPAPVILDYLGNNLGEKIIKLPLLLPLIVVAALLFREGSAGAGWGLQLPADPLLWLLFAFSLPPAAALAFLLDFVVGTLAFWLEDVSGLLRVKAVAGAFLEGQVIPLALFPPQLAPILAAQPFRYVVSFPLEILAGQLRPEEITWGFAAQLGYCVALALTYRLLWRRGLGVYAAAGA